MLADPEGTRRALHEFALWLDMTGQHLSADIALRLARDIGRTHGLDR